MTKVKRKYRAKPVPKSEQSYPEPVDEYETLERVILNALNRCECDVVRAMTLLASMAYRVRAVEEINRRERMRAIRDADYFEPPQTDPLSVGIRLLGTCYGDTAENEAWYAVWQKTHAE